MNTIGSEGPAGSRRRASWWPRASGANPDGSRNSSSNSSSNSNIYIYIYTYTYTYIYTLLL